MSRFYKDYAAFLSEQFPGSKMQKLTVDAGFSCPNRDGTFSRGGCAYCNNASFSPELGGGRSVAAQLQAGKAFFARKYPHMRYLAYFQSYTNTHGELGRLMRLYDEALAVEGIDGLIIGTRPDCLPAELLDALSERVSNGAWVMLELGAESSHDASLKRVNRCHTWGQTQEAVARVRNAGLHIGLHFIMGLPGETKAMMLKTVERASALRLDTIKFHQLQIIRGSRMGAIYEQGDASKHIREIADATLFTPEQYISLCVDIVGIMNRLSPSTAIERFTASAPSELLLAPCWGLKNYQFVNLLEGKLRDTNIDKRI